MQEHAVGRRAHRFLLFLLILSVSVVFFGCSRKEEPDVKKVEQKEETEQNNAVEETKEVEQSQEPQKQDSDGQIKESSTDSFEESIELQYIGGKQYVNQIGRGTNSGGAEPFEFETGYFAYYQEDYDNDGQGEILLLTLQSQGVDQPTIVVYMMYEEREAGWERVDSYGLEMESRLEKYWCDFLYRKVDGVPYFFQEYKQVSTYFSDGRTWRLNGIKYQDGYFMEIEPGISYEGSSDEPDFSIVQGEFEALGINIDDIDFEYHAFDMSHDIVKLANIQSNLNAQFFDSPYQTGEDFMVDGIDIIINDYTRESGVVQGEGMDSREYILPESNTRELTQEDLQGLSAEDLRIARNEILARYGRKFDDAKLQAYFETKSWYRGMMSPDDFSDSVLNEFEVKNLDLIQTREQELQN